METSGSRNQGKLPPKRCLIRDTQTLHCPVNSTRKIAKAAKAWIRPKLARRPQISSRAQDQPLPSYHQSQSNLQSKSRQQLNLSASHMRRLLQTLIEPRWVALPSSIQMLKRQLKDVRSCWAWRGSISCRKQRTTAESLRTWSRFFRVISRKDVKQSKMATPRTIPKSTKWIPNYSRYLRDHSVAARTTPTL